MSTGPQDPERAKLLKRLHAAMKAAREGQQHAARAEDLVDKLCNLIPSSLASTSAVAPVPAMKALEPRKPKPFNGEAKCAKHVHVRRFIRMLTQYFELCRLPRALWAPHARMYLEDSAAEHMDTACEALPASERNDWDKFCDILKSGFGNLDPDAEAWDKLRELKQRSLTASEYVHQMRSCFNGIKLLPLSAGDKIERFLSGMNRDLYRLVVTAPVGMGLRGKWLDPDSLMTYAVQQSQALGNGGASSSCPTYLEVASRKRPHEEGGSARPAFVRAAGKAVASAKKTARASFTTTDEMTWLSSNNRCCYHCTEQGHRSFECQQKKNGASAADMPNAFGKQPKA